MAEIQFRNVTKNYGKVIAVDDLTFTIPDKSFVTLLGPSGCGKTTTLRMIAGLELPNQGEVRLGDRVLSSSKTKEAVPPEQRGMGLVFQSYALWPHMTVAENINFGLQMQGKSRDFQKGKLAELAHLLHIEGLEGRYPLQLSGGQQQRVALARMLAISPHVLLLDEPLSNLDARLRMEMRAELKRLHEQLGNTIVYVTHDQLEAMTMATHVAVMHNGKLLQFGPPMDVYRQPANLFVAEFVGSLSINLFKASEPGASPYVISILDDIQRKCPGVERNYLSRVETVGLRAESLHITSDPARIPMGCWSQEVVLDTILPTGPEWVLSLRLGENLIFANVYEEPHYKSHEPLYLYCQGQHFHLFDKAGERVPNPFESAPAGRES